MQISVETTEGLERRLTIVVPANQVDEQVDNRLKESLKSMRLPGFRPGKAPLRVARQKYGAGVRQEVVEEVVRNSFVEAVQQEDLKPAGMPTIEQKQNKMGKDLKFIATFEIYPDLKLADCSGLTIEKPVSEVADSDVDTMVETLREQQASWQAVERKAKDGDQVNIDFVGTRDGEAFAGGSGEKTPLVLGSNSMIPGFEAGLVGKKAGDKVTLELTFPEDYHSEDLKGAAVSFEVTINSVNEKFLPEMDEDFFKSFGVDDGTEESFRAEIKQNMGRELQQAIKNRVKTQVMDHILEVNKEVMVPQVLIDGEIDELRQQAFSRFGGNMPGMDASLLPKELFQEQAERRVSLGLLLSEVIAQNELKADKEKVNAAIEEIASTYQDKDEVIEYYKSNPEQRRSIEAMVLEDLVVEHILSLGTVTDKPTSYADVMKPPAAEAAEE